MALALCMAPDSGIFHGCCHLPLRCCMNLLARTLCPLLCCSNRWFIRSYSWLAQLYDCILCCFRFVSSSLPSLHEGDMGFGSAVGSDMGVGLPRTKCHWSLNVEAWDAVLSWPSHHKYPCLLLPLSMPTTNPHVLWSGEIGPRPSTFLDCDSLPRWHRRRACEY